MVSPDLRVLSPGSWSRAVGDQSHQALWAEVSILLPALVSHEISLAVQAIVSHSFASKSMKLSPTNHSF